MSARLMIRRNRSLLTYLIVLILLVFPALVWAADIDLIRLIADFIRNLFT